MDIRLAERREAYKNHFDKSKSISKAIWYIWTITRASRSVKKGWGSRDIVKNDKSDSKCSAKQSKEVWEKSKWLEQNDLRLWAKQSKKDRDSRVKSTTSSAIRGVEQTKARKILTEPCLQWAERLEVLSKTKHGRLTRRQIYHKTKRLVVLSKIKQERSRQSCELNNKQRDSRCWANHSEKDWDGDMSTTSRATRSVEKNKERFYDWLIDN